MPQQGVHVVWKGHPCGLLRDICSQVLPGRDDIPAAHGVGAMKGGARGGSWFYLHVSPFNLIPFVYSATQKLKSVASFHLYIVFMQ